MQEGVKGRHVALSLMSALFLALAVTPAADAATVKSGGLTYVTERFEPQAGSLETLKAKCPAGTHVWGGGHYNTGTFEQALPRHSYPYDSGDKGTAPDDGWKAQISVIDGVEVRVHATCAELRPQYEVGSLPVAPMAQGSTEIPCAEGFEAVAGGTNGSAELVESRNGPAFGFGWFVSGDNYTLNPTTMQTFAVCIRRDVLRFGSNDAVVPRDQEGHITECGPGTRIVGGGVGHIGQTQDIVIAASSPVGSGSSGKDGWQVYLDNLDNSTTFAFTVTATCVKPLK